MNRRSFLGRLCGVVAGVSAVAHGRTWSLRRPVIEHFSVRAGDPPGYSETDIEQWYERNGVDGTLDRLRAVHGRYRVRSGYVWNANDRPATSPLILEDLED